MTTPQKRSWLTNVLLAVLIAFLVVDYLDRRGSREPVGLEDPTYQAELSGRSFNRLLGEAMVDIADEYRNGSLTGNESVLEAMKAASESSQKQSSKEHDTLFADLTSAMNAAREKQRSGDDYDERLINLDLADLIEASGRGRIAASK